MPLISQGRWRFIPANYPQADGIRIHRSAPLLAQREFIPPE